MNQLHVLTRSQPGQKPGQTLALFLLLSPCLPLFLFFIYHYFLLRKITGFLKGSRTFAAENLFNCKIMSDLFYGVIKLFKYYAYSVL